MVIDFSKDFAASMLNGREVVVCVCGGGGVGGAGEVGLVGGRI